MLLYTYISRFSVTPHYIKSGRVAATNAVPQPFLIAVSTSLTNAPRLLSQAKWVHTRLSEKDRTQGHTRRNRGRFGWGRYYYPRSVPHVHQHPRAGCQNGKLCRFGILAGRCSRRTQRACGTAMRLCASLSRRRRGPAGLRCSVCNLVMLLFFHSARRAFHTCKRGCGITTLGVLRVLSKRWAAACQKG